MQMLVLTVSGKRYGLRAEDVLEVARAVRITALPGAPAIVEGAIDLRGRVVPVFDLRARFGLPTRAVGPSERLVIARAGERVVAVRADEVEGIVAVEGAQVARADGLTRLPGHVASVAAPGGGELVVIADLARFLAAAEGAALDEALAREAQHREEER